MRKIVVLAASVVLVSTASMAEPMSLKCVVQDSKDGKQTESWIVIDTAENYMRVNGTALELSVTNDYYSSTTKPVGGFVTIRRLDRKSGEIVTSELYQSKVVWAQKGVCEKADPPATKF